jgi:hypothetical protein
MISLWLKALISCENKRLPDGRVLPRRTRCGQLMQYWDTGNEMVIRAILSFLWQIAFFMQSRRHRARGELSRVGIGNCYKLFSRKTLPIVLPCLDVSFDNGESDSAEQSIGALARV